MTSATGILRHEHEAILQMLGVAEVAARRLDAGQSVPAETLTGLLEFFRVFADRCHHGKEEDLLFPRLEERGLPRQGGPLQVMHHEHEQGRALVRAMAEAAAAYQQGDTAAGARWAAAARDYVPLLRRHIDKENNILFLMADNLLSAADQRELVAAFERVETEKLGAGTHERLHALMEKLATDVLTR